MEENEKKVGFYTTTRKVRLYTNNLEYLKITNEIYNETVEKYYNLLFENTQFLELSNQNCLRELEKITIKSKTGEKPKDYFEQNVPLYLRRAAINEAIGQVRTYFGLLENSKKNKNIKPPSKATRFNSSMTLYKGMYRNLADGKIELKLFDGNDWKWFGAKLKDWQIPEEGEILSPTVVMKKDYVMLHIPIKQRIEDVTPIKYRMKDENIRVCGIAFSNSDKFAICVALQSTGKLVKCIFVPGGDEYKNRTKQILGRIKKHRQKNWSYAEKDHKNYWIKLKNISEHYAHEISRKIVDFCVENKVQVISIAEIKDINEHFGKRVGIYSPIFLRKKIIEYMKYKAFKEGIIVTTVRSNYTGNRCYKCRSIVKRNGLKSVCEKGHQADYFFNTAMNIGIMCLKKFGKKIKLEI